MNTNFNNKNVFSKIEKNEESIKNGMKIDKGSAIFAILIIILVIIVAYSNIKEKNISVFKENNNKEIIENTFEDKNTYEDEIIYDSEKAEKDFPSQKENIIISKQLVNINKELILGIENKNEENLHDLDIYIVFYDGENKICKISRDIIKLLNSNSTAFIKIYETPTTFERYEVFITKEYFNENDIILNKDVQYSHCKENGKIKVSVQNNSSKKIDRLQFTVIYFDENDNILDIETIQEYDLKKNKTVDILSWGIINKLNYDKVEYAKYEVIFDYALNYNY